MRVCFNGHPPLGVNATLSNRPAASAAMSVAVFQRAPTLGGECYYIFKDAPVRCIILKHVSTGTHPWG